MIKYIIKTKIICLSLKSKQKIRHQIIKKMKDINKVSILNKWKIQLLNIKKKSKNNS